MNPILIKAIQFFLSLSLLIVLHELGHFIPAKIFKTRVEKFYLFFDVKFSLFKKKIGETVYGIGWLPLGGYVKISGMIDESMDTEAMAEEPKPCDQYIPTDSLKDGVNVVSKDIGDKIGIQTGDKVIAVDGKKVVEFNSVVMEIVNGNSITIERDDKTIKKEIPVDFIATLLEDEDKIRFLAPRIPFVIGEVPEDSANKNADLMPSDQITKIGDKNIRYFDEAKLILESYKGQKIELGLLRNNERLNVPVIISDSATIGVQLSGMTYQDMEKMGYLKVETKTYSFGESIPAGIDKGITTLSNYVKQLKKIFNPSTGAYKGVGGFASIGSLFPDTWNWIEFWSATAFISIILAFMNILPIPALDGGHVMFLLYEMITGRKPSDKFLEYAQMTGFFILIALLLFANGNDLYKWLFK